MIRLSVNVNKVATLRNSRGGRTPSVIDAVGVSVAAGAPGITVHPRADSRHIMPDDVREIARLLRPLPPTVEFNIEGDPRPELLDLVHEVRPDQCTLVPVVPGEVTSQAGWPAGRERDRLPDVVGRLKAIGGLHPQAPTGSSCTRNPSPEPSSAGPTRRAVRSRTTPKARGWRTRLAWPSTRAMIWTSRISSCSANFRSWPKCPSAMP